MRDFFAIIKKKGIKNYVDVKIICSNASRISK